MSTPRPHVRLLAIAVSASLAGSGCLAASYRIPSEEALRLSQTPPGQRGQRVRVLQRWSTYDDPREGRPVGASVQVGASASVSSSDRSSGSDGDSDGSSDSGSASDAAAAALAVLVIAAGAMAIVGGTEGARYDGWFRIHEREPIYLLGTDGTTLRVPLDELRPEHVLWADEVVLSGGDASWQRLGRAPLYRSGFTYGLDFGAGGLIARDGRVPWGFLGRMSFGGFPISELGFLGTITFGYSSLDAQTVFHARYAFEIHTYPIVLDRVHVGLHAEVGDEHRLEDLPSGGTLGDHGLFWGIGPLLQIDLTTRLALTVRGGVSFVELEDDMAVLGDASVGLAVY